MAKERKKAEEEQARQVDARRGDMMLHLALADQQQSKEKEEETLTDEQAQMKAMRELGKLTWHATREFIVP